MAGRTIRSGCFAYKPPGHNHGSTTAPGNRLDIEQTAARLNWPCVRINLDNHVSRIDLVGKDAIVLKDGKQVEALFAARRTRAGYRSGTTCSTATRRSRSSPAVATLSHAARGGTKNDGMSAR